MIDGSDPDAASQRAARRYEQALAYVCGHVDELRQDLSDIPPEQGGSRAALLADLTSALAAGRPVALVLDTIHEVLLNADDVLGLYGRFRPDQRGRPSGLVLAGLQVRPPDADEVVYLCPTDRCTRSSWPTAGQAPHCALTGRPLREDRL